MRQVVAARETLDILGVEVAAVDLEETVRRLSQWIDVGESRFVSLATAHGVMDARRCAEARRAFARADLVVPDGMSMVWLLKVAGYARVGRVYGPDLMRAVCALSVERGWSHYLLGGEEAVAQRLAARLEADFPGLRVAGLYSPPFRPLSQEENDEIVRRIDRSGARLVWVGLGSPKQDIWMANHAQSVPHAVLIGVGAAFDLLTGDLPQAPRWIQRSGLEWLFRFAVEPRRLARRYSRYPFFGLLVLARLPGWLSRRRAAPPS